MQPVPLVSSVINLQRTWPLQVQHCVLTSASLWARANHAPVLHATLSSKKPSWGHWPYTLHMLLSTAPRCQDKWRITQEFLPPFRAPPRMLSVDILPPGWPQNYLDILSVASPSFPRTHPWESWDPFKGTASMYISSPPPTPQCTFLLQSLQFSSFSLDKLYLLWSRGKNPKLWLVLYSVDPESLQGKDLWSLKSLSF